MGGAGQAGRGKDREDDGVMSTQTMYTAEELAQIGEALEDVKAAQTMFWDALHNLEALVTPEGAEFGVELNIDNTDLEGWTVDDVLAMAAGDEEEEEEDSDAGDQSGS